MINNSFVFLTKGVSLNNKPYFDQCFKEGRDFECHLIDFKNLEEISKIADTLRLRFTAIELKPFVLENIFRGLVEEHISGYYITFTNRVELNRFKLVYSEDYELLKGHSRTFLALYDHFK